MVKNKLDPWSFQKRSYRSGQENKEERMKLPEELQNALREGGIGVSQGYIFAANLDHPYLMDIT